MPVMLIAIVCTLGVYVCVRGVHDSVYKSYTDRVRYLLGVFCHG